ncbi:hypothetical protein E2C01_098828 [Portunus trituberculatus]|uniref:Uncharacterized protein n=1 Tax=Portunus trituberculatus TaxID=210409 RepID=A0A5B7K3X1_PORTR|nr:hypothetical protein [Portunus trituberculatus]
MAALRIANCVRAAVRVMRSRKCVWNGAGKAERSNTTTTTATTTTSNTSSRPDGNVYRSSSIRRERPKRSAPNTSSPRRSLQQ